MLITGVKNRQLELLKKHFDSKVIARGDKIILEGEKEEVAQIQKLFSSFIDLINEGKFLNDDIILREIEKIKKPKIKKEEDLIYTPKKIIRPKSPNQAAYIRNIRESDIVFAIGPAGTGKTYLAIAMAVEALTNEEVNKIILTRPAVEAGESLGYLPGDLKEKVDPYLRPLYDALGDVLPMEKIKRMMENQIIEVAPLAYMRGRTLSDAYIILDEAQNTTYSQMKMFLTRLGWNSKAIITGDITQIDLSEFQKSGLIHAIELLKSIPEIKFIYFGEKDVVRPPLVSKIVKAYEEESRNSN